MKLILFGIRSLVITNPYDGAASAIVEARLTWHVGMNHQTHSRSLVDPIITPVRSGLSSVEILLLLPPAAVQIHLHHHLVVVLK
jgi:hypothetical protein